MARHKRLLYGVAALLMLIGCAYNIGYVKTTYDLLAVSQTSYETAISTVIDLHRQGRITDGQKAEAFDIGRQFANAHNAAVEALAKYEESGHLGSDEQLELQVVAAYEALSTLLNLVKPYLLEKED